MRGDRPERLPVVAAPAGSTSRPIRVCHLAYSFYESDNRVMRYAELLAANGAAVDVIGLRRPGQPRRDRLNGVELSRLQRRTVNEGPAWSYLLKLLWFVAKSSVVIAARHLRRPYDVVHVHNVPDFLVFAAIVPRLTGATVLLDIHDILPELYAGKFGAGPQSMTFRLLLSVERASCRFAHHVIVANHLWHAKLVSRSVSAARCSAFLNYPDRLFFAPRPPRDDAGPFVFLYPGSLNHHQGLDLAIDAFTLVAADMPGAELHIYGDGPERPALAAQIARLGMSATVRIRDKVPLSAVPELMASARVGIVPKRASGFGNEAFSTKVLEFMACRVPVIVTRTSVDRYYFDDSCVTFAEPEDVASMGAAMRRLYADAAAAAAQADRGFEVATQWSWQVHGGAYTSLIATSLSSRPLDRECSTP